MYRRLFSRRSAVLAASHSRCSGVSRRAASYWRFFSCFSFRYAARCSRLRSCRFRSAAVRGRFCSPASFRFCSGSRAACLRRSCRCSGAMFLVILGSLLLVTTTMRPAALRRPCRHRDQRCRARTPMAPLAAVRGQKMPLTEPPPKPLRIAARAVAGSLGPARAGRAGKLSCLDRSGLDAAGHLSGHPRGQAGK